MPADEPRQRDEQGRPLQQRPRDRLGRPLPHGQQGVAPLPEPLPTEPTAALALAQRLLDDGLPFQAHEVLEEMWRTCPQEQRPAWQGLAQLAVAVTHSERGNPHGARRLLGRAAANLAGLAGSAPPGVAADLVLDWLGRARAAATAGRPLPALRLRGGEG